MRDIVDKLQSKRLIFKSLKSISPKELGSRKRIEIYLGVDLDRYYSCIIHINKKSRVIQKDAKELMALHKKLEEYNSSAIKKKYIYIQAPLCSKAKKLLKENGWRILMD
jgi:hypothetical protein